MSTTTAKKGRWNFRNIFFGGADKKKAATATNDRPQSEHTQSGVSTTSSMMSVDSQTSEVAQVQKQPQDQQPQQQAPVPMAVDAVAPTANGSFGRTISGYEILDTLGKGMSGKVKRGRCPNTGRTVALKIIDKAAVPRRVLMMLQSEIQAMKALQAHPHILSLLDCNLTASYPRKRGGSRDVVCLALELAPGGELFDFLMYTGAFPEDIAKAIFMQLASAIAFCHDRNIYHRDIKPENLLLDENYQLKVADFGLAAIRTDPETLLRTECGTRSYMAPEVLARQQYDGKKADCWSVGVVLFIMLSGNPPFQMARPGDWWFNQLKDKKPEKFWRSHLRYSPNFPKPAQELITKIFTPDPAARPTVKDLLSDPWLASSSVGPADITRELRTRKEKIIADKAAEKERARRKKEAGQHGGNGKKEFENDKVKHRDVQGVEGQLAQVTLEETKAPLATDKVLSSHSNTSLYSAESAKYCMQRLRETVGVTLKGEILTKADDELSRFKMVAVIPADESNKVETEIRVWSVPDDDTCLIQVSRKAGDPVGFHSIFNTLREETFDLYGEDGQREESFRGLLRQSTMPAPVESDDEGEAVLASQQSMI